MLTPTFYKGHFQLDGKIVGFLFVDKYLDPPIIVCRDGENLNDGEIIFRYPGQSARIKYGDLLAMLRTRDQRGRQRLAIDAMRIAAGNAATLSLNSGLVEGKTGQFIIDEELMAKLQFIREGEFREVSGAPTLKLIGDLTVVNTIGRSNDRVVGEAIFQEDILNVFLSQSKIDQPFEYIRAGLALSRWWLPIFYFARLTGQSNAEISAQLSASKSFQKDKKAKLLQRLAGKRSAFAKKTTQPTKKCTTDLSNGDVAVPKNISDALLLARGILGIKQTKAKLGELHTAVQSAKKIVEEEGNGNNLGDIYKAACRIDELYFS